MARRILLAGDTDADLDRIDAAARPRA